MQQFMQPSENGLHLTQHFEQCRLKAYKDQGGVWTIGWGHTGPEVTEGLVWTKQQADEQLQLDYKYATHTVNGYVKVQLTQPEFDALCDFVFNVGGWAFAHSTMVKQLNAGNYTGAAEELLRWHFVKGKPCADLLARREQELDLWGINPQAGAD